MEEKDFKVSKKTNKIDFSTTIRKMWEVIAQRPSEFDMEIIDALKATVHSTNITSIGYNSKSQVYAYSDDKYGCYGDKLYLVMREKMIKFKTPNGKKINLLPGCDLQGVMIESNASKIPDPEIPDPEIPEPESQKSEKTETKINTAKIQKKKDIPPTKVELILQRATIDKLTERLDKILA